MAFLLRGHFHIREHYLRGHFNKCHESSTKQCNEHDMKLNVTAKKLIVNTHCRKSMWRTSARFVSRVFTVSMANG